MTTYIKVKTLQGSELWINPDAISIIKQPTSATLEFTMSNGQLVSIEMYANENKQICDYMQLWAPPKKKVL